MLLFLFWLLVSTYPKNISQIGHLPQVSRGENKTYLKPPPSSYCTIIFSIGVDPPEANRVTARFALLHGRPYRPGHLAQPAEPNRSNKIMGKLSKTALKTNGWISQNFALFERRNILLKPILFVIYVRFRGGVGGFFNCPKWREKRWSRCQGIYP